MEDVSEEEKKNLAQKLLGFQKQGLIAYGNYLQDQLVFASKSSIRNQYKKYIEDQIAMNLGKIMNIDSRL